MLTRAQEAALRLLVDTPPVCRLDLDELDWTELRAVGASCGVLVRLADAVTARSGEMPPPLFTAATARACAAAQHTLEIVDRLSVRCNALGLQHAFLHVVQRYPDSGNVTLLVGAPNTPAIDRQLLSELPVAWRAPRRRMQRWLGGASVFCGAYGVGIRIRHGRVGRFGEHARYARLVLERAGLVPVGQTTCRAPTQEDHLLLLVIERTYTRPAFRLGDLAWAIPVLRTVDLNWDYLFAAAVSTGMLAGVAAYLEYVNGIHLELFGDELIDPSTRARFRGPVTRPAAHPGDSTRFPAAGFMAQAYLGQVGETLDSGRWHSAARLSLLPLVAMLAGRHARGKQSQ